MDYRENIRAILDTNLPQIKDEVKETIINVICDLDRPKENVKRSCSKLMITKEFKDHFTKKDWKDYEEVLKNELARSFLPIIKDNMIIREEYDYRWMEIIYYATIDFIKKED